MAATTLRILTAGATREGIAALADALRAETGVAIETATAHGHLITERLIAGESGWDVVMLTDAMIFTLDGHGLIAPGCRARLGEIRIGAAVRAGRKRPDVSTMEALRRAVLAADSILITEAPSGVHMEKLFARMHIADAIADRITRYDTGTMVNEHLAASDRPNEIGFGVATEIKFFRHRGVAWAGPLPEEAQMTATYSAALLGASAQRAAAEALMRFLETNRARAAFAETGVETGR